MLNLTTLLRKPAAVTITPESPEWIEQDDRVVFITTQRDKYGQWTPTLQIGEVLETSPDTQMVRVGYWYVNYGAQARMAAEWKSLADVRRLDCWRARLETTNTMTTFRVGDEVVCTTVMHPLSGRINSITPDGLCEVIYSDGSGFNYFSPDNLALLRQDNEDDLKALL